MEFWSLLNSTVNLVEHYLSENTWNVYANAEKSFQIYRKNDIPFNNFLTLNESVLSVRLFIFILKPIATI
jgi:hypothetical protein